MKIERYAYKNTTSEAGQPEQVEFNTEDVTQMYVWTNFYGNPTYSIFLSDGTSLLCVDDYGCENDMTLTAKRVQRKKDLF